MSGLGFSAFKQFWCLALVGLMAISSPAAMEPSLQLGISTAVEQLSWTVEDGSENGYRSTLSWRDLVSVAATVKVGVQVLPWFMMEVNLKAGGLIDGFGTDQDDLPLSGETELIKTLVSTHNIEGNQVLAGGIATRIAGPNSFGPSFSLGYAADSRTLRMIDGEYIFVETAHRTLGATPLGSILGLDSRFTAQFHSLTTEFAWTSPNLTKADIQIRLGVEGAPLRLYRAWGEWNLRSFDYFYQQAWGRSLGATLAISAMTDIGRIAIQGRYGHSWFDPGDDYVVAGSNQAYTPLVDVQNSDWSFALSIRPF